MFKIKKLLKKIKIVRSISFNIKFITNNKYYPNFNIPRTYNEKINFRKRNYKNELFSLCSDKVNSKEYVSKIIGPEVIIENYFIGKNISVEKIKEIVSCYGDCYLKANHNSGPVYSINKNSTDEYINKACDDVNNQLKIKFGEINGELWYDDINPKVLVEKRLTPVNGESDVRDYKFHVFKQKDGTQKIIVHVDYDRSNNHNRSYFTEALEWIPLAQYAPIIHTKFEKPKCYEDMLDIVKKLALPFSYVRVDLYNIDGDIYFGELTFAPGSGMDPFNSKEYDLWLGNLWQCDPRF